MANVATLNTGATMPLVGLGTWKSKKGEVEAAVKTALEVGYRNIDCAAIYGNEEEIGAALASAFANGLKREDVFITSKLWNTKHAKQDVRPALEKTLKDLGLQYLDLYLIHWPHGFQRGENTFPKDDKGNILYADTPYLETWQAMEELVTAGLTKAIGLSNFNSQQINDVFAAATVKPSVLQIESHPYFIQKDLIPFAMSKGLVVTAYSPLGSLDRPWRAAGDPALLDEPLLKEIGAKYGKSAAQVVLRYQVQRGVVVIPKSVRAERLKENFEVFDFTLSDEDVKAVESFDRQYRFCVPMIEVDGKSVPRDGAHPYYPFNIPF